MNTTTFNESNNEASATSNEKRNSTMASVTELMTLVSMWAVTSSVVILVSLTWV